MADNALKRRNALMDASQGVSKGFWADGIGGPVDMLTTLANLGIAGGGYAGHKLGLLSQPPELIQNPVGGSEWIAAKMRGAGLLNDNPGSTADAYGRVAGGLLAPLTAARAPQIANALQQAPEAMARAASPKYVAMGGGVTGKQGGALYVGKNKLYPNAYHGTATEFKRVDFDAAEANRENLDLGNAFWMTTDPGHASNYAAAAAKGRDVRTVAKVKEANVFLKNPMTVDAFGEATQIADQIGVPAPTSWPEAANILQYAKWAKDNIDDAMRLGHDALIIKNTGDAPIAHDYLPLSSQLADQVAVFKPNRVRLKP